MIRLLALDLDGTVLGPGREIAPAGCAALQAAERAGVHVTLATGRMLRSAAAVRERLSLHGPLVAYNGGLVRLPDGGGWTDPVPLEAAHAVGDLCRQRGYFVQAYLDDALYVPFEDGRAEAYAELAGVTYIVDPTLAYAPPVGPTKLLIIEPEDRQPEVRAALASVAAGYLELANSYPHYLEISRRGVDKGTALARLADALGVPGSAVMAVGDGENDLPMIRYAGVGAAVANAVPALTAVADFTASARFGDGVAEAVRRFIPAAAGEGDAVG